VFLRTNGIEASMDLPAAEERQDWPLWMTRGIQEAQFVLVIASPEYRRRAEEAAMPDEGRGVQWEASLIREEIYADRAIALKKYLPVLLPGHSTSELPSWLGPTSTTHYNLTTFPAGDTERLLRTLTNQPYEIVPPLGPMPCLPPRSQASSTGNKQVVPRATSEHSAADLTRLDLTNVSNVAEPGLIAPLSRLFLHFFDPHFLDEVSRGRNAPLVSLEANSATRLAVLTAETVFVPAASYIESDLCARTVNEYRAVFDRGQIVLVGSEANLVDFATAKLLQYEPGSDRFRRYERAISFEESATPPFRSRSRSATTDITTAWNTQLEDLPSVVGRLPSTSFRDLEEKWAAVPEILAGRAFTPEYAVAALFSPAPTTGPELIMSRRAGSHINANYFRSYTDELEAGVITDLSYLHSPHTGSHAHDLSYKAVVRSLRALGVLEIVLEASAEQLMELRHDTRVAAAIMLAMDAT